MNHYQLSYLPLSENQMSYKYQEILSKSFQEIENHQHPFLNRF